MTVNKLLGRNHTDFVMPMLGITKSLVEQMIFFTPDIHCSKIHGKEHQYNETSNLVCQFPGPLVYQDSNVSETDTFI